MVSAHRFAFIINYFLRNPFDFESKGDYLDVRHWVDFIERLERFSDMLCKIRVLFLRGSLQNAFTR